MYLVFIAVKEENDDSERQVVGKGSNICMASAVSLGYSCEMEGQKFARLTCRNRTFNVLSQDKSNSCSSALPVRPFAVAAGAKLLRDQSQASVFTSEKYELKCLLTVDSSSRIENWSHECSLSSSCDWMSPDSSSIRLLMVSFQSGATFSLLAVSVPSTASHISTAARRSSCLTECGFLVFAIRWATNYEALCAFLNL